MDVSVWQTWRQFGPRRQNNHAQQMWAGENACLVGTSNTPQLKQSLFCGRLLAGSKRVLQAAELLTPACLHSWLSASYLCWLFLFSRIVPAVCQFLQTVVGVCKSLTKGRLEVFLFPSILIFIQFLQHKTPRCTKLTLNLHTLGKFGLSYLLTMSLTNIALSLLVWNWF